MKLIIIDRDGVISRDPEGRTANAEKWRSMPGGAEAIARLTHAGYRVAMLADCGPLVRGACDMVGLNALHARIINEIHEAGGRIDTVVFVPAPDAPARCAAVASALKDLMERLDVLPSATVLVSDSRHELDAAHAAGCRPVLVLTGHGQQTLEGPPLPPETTVRIDLAAVAAELAH